MNRKSQTIRLATCDPNILPPSAKCLYCLGPATRWVQGPIDHYICDESTAMHNSEGFRAWVLAKTTERILGR